MNPRGACGSRAAVFAEDALARTLAACRQLVRRDGVGRIESNGVRTAD